ASVKDSDAIEFIRSSPFFTHSSAVSCAAATKHIAESTIRTMATPIQALILDFPFIPKLSFKLLTSSKEVIANKGPAPYWHRVGPLSTIPLKPPRLEARLRAARRPLPGMNDR